MPERRSRPHVLFVAEDVTLAHVGRCITLASALDSSRYRVSLACGERYRRFVTAAGLGHVRHDSMPADYFADRLARGKTVHTRDVLTRSIADDQRLFEAERPDLVIGDFRISLGISAELAHLPYWSITNGHWSPATTLGFPLPEHRAVALLGERLTRLVFPRLVLPMVLASYLRPFNRLRQAYGLAPVDSLGHMYTHATRTLYADLPRLAPVSALPSGHEYIGPVLWEPKVSLPAWWNELGDDRPLVFVNVGSSGSRAVLAAAIDGLAELPVTVVIATAGASSTCRERKNVFVADYLPGALLCERAQIVVTSGGSAPSYQALARGKPIVGIPANADQYFFMESAAHHGLGVCIRSGKVDASNLARAVTAVLDNPSFARRAEQAQSDIAAMSTLERFRRLVHHALPEVTPKLAVASH